MQHSIDKCVLDVERDLSRFYESIKFVQDDEDIMNRYANFLISVETLKFIVAQHRLEDKPLCGV